VKGRDGQVEGGEGKERRESAIPPITRFPAGCWDGRINLGWAQGCLCQQMQQTSPFSA